MKVLELILLIIVVMMSLVTFYYFKKQKNLVKKRRKRAPKYELIEFNEKDDLFHDYYEPKIVEVVSNEEYL